jgi:hypothetical protein
VNRLCVNKRRIHQMLTQEPCLQLVAPQNFADNQIVVAAATFAANSTMFGLPIASSTAARTVSNGFREVMLHRCTFT